MDKVIEVIQWVLTNYQVVITDSVGVLTALITLFALIPGDQPEKALQGVVDWIKKFSNK